MKIFMLAYQFTYYWMTELNGKRAAWLARFRALTAMVIIEAFIFASLLPGYTFVATSLGSKLFTKLHDQSAIVSVRVDFFRGVNGCE